MLFVEVRAARGHRRVLVQAGTAGSMVKRPFPVPGDHGLCFLAAARQRSPLDELALGPLPPLRCGPVPPARSSPRSPAKPEAGPLEIPETANL